LNNVTLKDNIDIIIYYLFTMYQSYVSPINNLKHGQTAPRADHEAIMINNLAGGYTYQVSDKEYLERVLILGTNGNTYYASAMKMTADAMNYIKNMIKNGKGKLVVDIIKDIYENGRAPKQDSTFFALAMVTQEDVPVEVKTEALELIAKLRTFSHLYTLEGMRKALGGKKGFGRGMRKSMLKLVKNKTGKQFAYQATKYRSRKCGEESWSIDDIIKCSHIPSKDLSEDGQLVLVYLIKGMEKCEEEYAKLQAPSNGSKETIGYLRAVEAVKSGESTVDTVIQLVRQYNLPREVLNTSLLNSVEVWNALLFTTSVGECGKIVRRVTMPINALFRNLGVMSSKGVFGDQSVATLVGEHIVKQHILKNGYVHPVTVLLAKLTYKTGHSLKGKLIWPVNNTILNALEEAFYVSFQAVEGTGKKILHAVDCSGSMICKIASVPQISSCEAVGTLVMEAVRREHKYAKEMKAKGTPVDNLQEVMLFSKSGNKVTISPDMKLEQVMKIIQSDYQTTDCSQPIIKALEEYRKTNGKSGCYDLFIVYTDNETYASGSKHPSELLDEYIKETGLQSRLVIYATTPTMNTIGYGYCKQNNVFSPKEGTNSSLTLNIAGFDLNGPTLIRNFAMGSLGLASQEDDEEEIEE
jgi:60 kDa SS-A/Ro ribonucleoprotein